MSYPNEFAIADVVQALQALLAAQLAGTNVDTVGERDIDEEGDLIMLPPSARILFIDERTSGPFDNQAQSYNVDQAYAVLCVAEDLSSVEAQRIATMQLAGQVKHLLVGARLVLPNGNISEPIVYAGLSTLPTKSAGMAYAVGLTIGGIAQFAAPNAYPTGGQ